VKKGFTLVETVIGLAVLALVVYGLSVFIVKGIEAWQLLRERNILQIESRIAMSRMLDQVRGIPSTLEVTTMNSSAFSFYDHSGVSHTIRLGNGGTYYYLDLDGYSLSDNLTSDGLSFTYRNAAGNSAATAAELRSIRIALKLSKGGEHFELQSACRLRAP